MGQVEPGIVKAQEGEAFPECPSGCMLGWSLCDSGKALFEGCEGWGEKHTKGVGPPFPLLYKEFCAVLRAIDEHLVALLFFNGLSAFSCNPLSGEFIYRCEFISGGSLACRIAHQMQILHKIYCRAI